MSNCSPIGVFDSGIGGLTLFKELSLRLPHEHLIYLGDSARLPYGSKSPETITQFTRECAAFLLKQKIKLLLVACHTASAIALESLCKELPIPVIGVVQAGFELLVHAPRNQQIAILGTAGTIQSGIYQSLLKQALPHSTLFPLACPLFVPLAEENFANHEAAELIARHYLQPLTQVPLDAVLLACTHYPLLKQPIQKVLGSSVAILEPAARCIEQVFQTLADAHQLNPSQETPTYQFFATDNPLRFAQLAKTFLGRSLEPILLRLSLN